MTRSVSSRRRFPRDGDRLYRRHGWILKYAIGAFTGATLGPGRHRRFCLCFRLDGVRIWKQWLALAALFFCILILMFGVGSGIENANKLMMPVFFILFVFLGIYVAFQPGAMQGYRYIFRIDPEILADPKTWIFALGQAFFSLSVAGNGTLIYGSYLSDEENIPASAARVALFDTIAAILAALVIIPAMATTGAKLDQGGPGLLFIYLPNLIRSMPGGTLIAIIFFVAVLFAGMTSLLNLYEAPIATVQEKLHLGRVPACAVIGIIGAAVSLLTRDRLRLDGRSLHLHLPPRCRTRRNHVLLGIRKRLCRNAGQQRPRKEIFKGLYRCAAIFIFRYVCWY